MNTGKLLRNKGKTRAYQIKTWNLSPGGTNIDSPGTAYLLTSHRNSTSDGFDSFGSWNCSDVLDFFGVGGLSLNSHEAEEAFLFVPGLLDFFDTRTFAQLVRSWRGFARCFLLTWQRCWGEQPLLSFLGSGDYDVFPLSLPCNDRQML